MFKGLTTEAVQAATMRIIFGIRCRVLYTEDGSSNPMRSVRTCISIILRTADVSVRTVSRLIVLVCVGKQMDTVTLIFKGSISLTI